MVYYKDRYPTKENEEYFNSFDTFKFASVEEDDKQARETIKEFNKLRSSVLTTHLLDAGLTLGSDYSSYTFANRLMESSTDTNNQPLNIAIFGSSFTIGSNCGESSGQDLSECAWPERLIARWDELLANQSMFPNAASVAWRHYQENAQNSANIGQKLPAILDEYQSKNTTPDVIILDNTINDLDCDYNCFEAVVRVMVKFFPGAVIISIIDAIPRLVDRYSDYESAFLKRMGKVHNNYGLTSIDIATMVKILHYNNATDGLDHTKDLLWPQADYMITSNGTKCKDFEPDCDRIVGPVY